LLNLAVIDQYSKCTKILILKISQMCKISHHMYVKKTLGFLQICIASTFLSGCAISPIASERANEELTRAGEAYAVVDALVPADTPDARKACAEGKMRPSWAALYCGDLSNYEIMTGTVAATSRKSSLRVFFPVPIAAAVEKRDIVKFRFAGESHFINIASRGERKDCHWTGDSVLMIGFPGQEGGIECDGWSYKSLMHIDWKPKTWLPIL
jgi:hypothetical protein